MPPIQKMPCGLENRLHWPDRTEAANEMAIKHFGSLQPPAPLTKRREHLRLLGRADQRRADRLGHAIEKGGRGRCVVGGYSLRTFPMRGGSTGAATP
jgi:hypothetical protein